MIISGRKVIEGIGVDWVDESDIFGGNSNQFWDDVRLDDNERVTAIEYHSFSTESNLIGSPYLCDISIFTKNETGVENRNGPYPVQTWDSPNAGLCTEMATDRFYGEIPSNMTFKEFLGEFSSIVGGYGIGISSPPWTTTTTTTTTNPTTATTTTTSTTQGPLVLFKVNIYIYILFRLRTFFVKLWNRKR